MLNVGKREFLLHTSKYLKIVENKGENVVINHHNKPVLKIIPFKPKKIKDLSGLITHLKIKGDINDHVLPGFDLW